MKDRNMETLIKISNYCNEVELTINRFGRDSEIFHNDRDYKNSICISLLQIGELTTHLSEDFRSTFSKEVDWRGCKVLRNIVAHRYGTVNYDIVWKAATEEIPEIKSFCDDKIALFNLINAPSISPDEANDEYVDDEQLDLTGQDRSKHI